MNKITLITKPSFDITTFYISYYADKIIDYLEINGMGYKSFDGEKATRDNVHKFMEKKKPKFVFLNGPGSDSMIEGHKGEILFSLEDKNKFNSELIYARSCLVGKTFGKEVFKDKSGCFIGYENAFTFLTDSNYSNDPSKDKVANYFLEPSNEVALSIVKGNSAKESHKRGKQAMLKNMKKLMNEPNALPLLEALWNNFDGQVIYGNENQVLN